MPAFSVTSMTAPLRRVAVRGLPEHADPLDAGWHRPPDRDLAATQHTAFVAALEAAGAQFDVLLPTQGLADSCFVYDPVFVTGRGMVVLRQAKPVRSAEPPLLATELAALGVPEIGRLTDEARADGGDLCWLDEQTLAVGRGYRTNAAAHAQLRDLLVEEGVEVLSFDLPHDRGPREVLHLMSLVSPIDARLAVVYEPLAPVALLDALSEREIRWVAVSGEEYAALGSNVLATGPGRVVMFEGSPQVADALRAEGVDVTLVDCSEFAIGDGGPTCLTRPLLRG
ncbi:MAG: dimethylarginine dimethylaminohydrolase family protein [Nocardioides sp.]